MTVEKISKKNDEGVYLAREIISASGITERQTIRVIQYFQSLSRFWSGMNECERIFTEAATDLGVRVPTPHLSNPEELKTLFANRVCVYDRPANKDIGVIRGLSHGFYRGITIPQIFESAIKADYCDEHCLLIESDLRITFYKKKEPVYTEAVRTDFATISGIADKVGIIRGFGYSNKFYRSLVKKWKPDVYFVNKGSGYVAIKEAEYRAKMVGAELVVTPEISGRHTTDFINSIRSRS